MINYPRTLYIRGKKAVFAGRKYAITFNTISTLVNLWYDCGWRGADYRGSYGPFGLWVRVK